MYVKGGTVHRDG